MRKIIALITLIIALTVINWSIFQKETLLADGQVVYLELAPVDPRSLMQGDYMALRFAMTNNINATLTSNLLLNDINKYNASFDGTANVTLNEHNVATLVSISIADKLMNDTFITTPSADPLLGNTGTEAAEQTNTSSQTNNMAKTQPLQFRVRQGRVKFATNAYFFEEGTGDQLTSAIYGEFRVSETGELLLVALRDKALVKLGS